MLETLEQVSTFCFCVGKQVLCRCLSAKSVPFRKPLPACTKLVFRLLHERG